MKDSCVAHNFNKVDKLPQKKKRIEKKHMRMQGFICIKNNCIGLNLHKEGSLLGGLWNIPMKTLENDQYDYVVKHIFTHINLELCTKQVEDVECDEFIPLSELNNYPLSRLTRKAIMNYNLCPHFTYAIT